MARFYPSGGAGGGVGSNELTATLGDVLKGKTVVANDTGDEIGTGTLELTGDAMVGNVLSGKTFYSTNPKSIQIGTMPNNGAVAPSALGAGGSYTIPAGYHNGSGKVTVQSLADMTASGDATAAQILTGKKAYVDGNLITGSMADQGAKTSSLNCGGSYTIPAGYHNGSGKVTANSLASQTDATATAAYIKTGYTAWVKGSKLTGSMAVTSAINFKATALSGSSIRISWTNPSKGPWQGVFIQMSTSGSPGTSGGTRIYTGTGVNTAPSGSNYVDITGLSLATTYYFTCTSYCDALGWGSSYNVSATTKGYVLFDKGATNSSSDDTILVTAQKKTVTDYAYYWLLYASDDYQFQMPAIDYSKYTKLGLVASFGAVNTSTPYPGVTFYKGTTFVKKVLDQAHPCTSADTKINIMFDISTIVSSLTATDKYNILIRPWSADGTYTKPTINMYNLWLE